jgi:HK97 gp10 family phage protein
MIEGLDKLIKELETAGKELTQEEVKKIVRNESEVLINTARTNAPTTDIKNAIGFIEKNEAKFTKTVLIGPRYYGSYKGQLAHTFEYGTAPRYTKDGKYRGHITARPFMRPAFDTHAKNIVTNVKNRIFKLVTEKIK